MKGVRHHCLHQTLKKLFLSTLRYENFGLWYPYQPVRSFLVVGKRFCGTLSDTF